jgi:SAM-dependent methyltransferase
MLKELPPDKLLWDNGTNVDNFRVVGEEFFKYFLELCHLAPGDRVLDVGSGLGRMAVPLTGYLDSHGSYDGFDIGKPAIDWCVRTITPQFPNFRFHLANIRNSHYNPRGPERAETYRFPFADGVFDFAFASSVLTHLLPGAAAQYLREIQRTLRPGGRCLVSCFLLNDESRSLMARGRSTLPFTRVDRTYSVLNPSVPETAVAYEQSAMERLFQEAGLTPPQVHFGQWCGRSEHLSYQDILISRKAEAPPAKPAV